MYIAQLTVVQIKDRMKCIRFLLTDGDVSCFIIFYLL